jgi:alanine dehydrogenase
MIIGVPRETHRHEHRVGLNPFAVSRLTQQGHLVLVENDAGRAARFTMSDYRQAGGEVVYDRDEVFRRADVICRVGLMSSEELSHLKTGSVICGFQHLAVAPRQDVRRLMDLEATLIGYEIIRDKDGDLPVLTPFSQMGGRMAVNIAAHYLQNERGGRGILLGNTPGVPPPTVLILGAGTVGRAAARQALACGVHVIVLDDDLGKLRDLDRQLSGQVVTVVAARERLAQYTAIADVVIGAVLIPGARAPFLITEEMVKTMKAGSVIVDVSIDQGGCVETSRPTSLENPVYTVHDVVHYCVPNMTANVARTASRTLANSALPYITEIADRGLDAALQSDPGLAAGVYLYRGKIVNERLGEILGTAATPLEQLLAGSPAS